MKLDGALYREKTVSLLEEEIELRYRMYSQPLQDRLAYCLVVDLADTEGVQECFLFDIAVSFSMADRIWTLFTEGLVTPMTAEDILADLLSDRDFLYADE